MDAESYLKLEDMDILLKKIDLLDEENAALKKRVEFLERRLAEYETKYGFEIHVESEFGQHK